MIDIHNHIVFDVDDGSKSLEQSIRMIKSASEAGITEICMTPHYMEDGYKTEKSILIEKFETLKEIVSKENIQVELYLGEEVFIFPDMPENLDKLISLNDSRYILMEFPLIEEISYINEVIYRLLSYGKVPIIAHPERYLSSEKDFGFIKNLLQKGALLQVNINSLVGHYGKEAKQIATKLLKNNMVQFIGSDAHSAASYRILPDSLAILRKIVNEEVYEKLTHTNPKMMLDDELIEYDASYTEKPVKSKKNSWFANLLRKKVES